MAGIRVLKPIGPGWEYSLDKITYQTDTRFTEQSPGVPFVEGEDYAVYCRNTAEQLEAIDYIPFGDADNLETLDKVARRNPKTAQQLTLTGGLKLQNLPSGTGYHLLVDAQTGEVYTSGTTTNVAPMLLFGDHYEAIPVNTEPPFTVPAGSPPLLAGNYSGSLDAGTCDYVGGWAARRDALNQVVSVDVYKNGVKHATVPGNGLRGDVATAIGSTANQYYGWHYDVPPSDRTGTIIIWSAKISGTDTELTYSPKTSNVCGTVATTVKRTFPDGPDQLNEAGPVGQYVLKEELTDGTIRTIRPDAWALPGAPAGITVDANGVLTPGSNLATITSTVTIGLRAVVGSNTYEKPVRIINANAVNPPPAITPFPDTVITALGDVSLSLAGTFTDSDALSISVTGGTGETLPAGINFTLASLNLVIGGAVPNMQLAIRQRATDTAQNVVDDAFLLTINRQTGPTRQEVSRGIVGSSFDNEGTTHSYRLRVNFNDNSTDDITHTATKALEGWRTGEVIDNEGNVTIPTNQVVGDSHELIVVMNVAGVRYTKSVQVVDVSTGPPRPAGAENCTNYGKLTQAQYDAASTTTIYEYLLSTPNAQGALARAFNSRTEAITHIPTTFNAGSKSNYDVVHVLNNLLPVGATLYGNNQPPDGDFQKWPAEAGFWGISLTKPQGGNAGSFILLQTNACGVITARETVIIPA